MSAEPAVAIEWPGDAPAVSAVVHLQSAVRAPHLVLAIDDHGRLIAPRTEARRNERKWWKFHISVTTGITIGRRRVRLKTVLETASWIASLSVFKSA